MELDVAPVIQQKAAVAIIIPEFTEVQAANAVWESVATSITEY